MRARSKIPRARAPPAPLALSSCQYALSSPTGESGGEMDFEFSDTSKRIQAQLKAFIAEHIAPRDSEYRHLVAQGVFPPPFIEDLKAKARAAGLWNLFLPGLKSNEPGTRMSNLDYAPCAEIMGRMLW